MAMSTDVMANGKGMSLADQLAPIVGVIEPSESRRHIVEAGIKALHETEHERDDLRRRLETALVENRALQAEMGALQVALSRQQNEIEQYRHDRDQAVAKRAEVEAVFGAALTLMQKHRGPTLLDGAADKKDT
jgi:regulator of replication initiation timing